MVNIKKVVYVGAGHVGISNALITAMYYPESYVICYDHNEQLINKINRNIDEIPIYGVELLDICYRTKKKNLLFSSNIKNSLIDCEIGLPLKWTKDKSNKTSGSLKLAKIREVILKFLPYITIGKTVIAIKSTLTVNGCERIMNDYLIQQYMTQFIKNNPDKNDYSQFDIIYNPEFSSPSDDFYTLCNPHRIVIGGCDNNPNGIKNIQCLIQFYQRWIDPKNIKIMSTKSAEITKLASNSLLAQRISSINTIADMCKTVGADISNVVDAIRMDNRIGSKHLEYGIGFGGICLQKDVQQLSEDFFSQYNCVYPDYWNIINHVNKLQTEYFVNHFINKAFGKNNYEPLKKSIITVYGLTFKKNTCDIRLSQSIKIINKLLKYGAHDINLYDPCITTSDSRKVFEKYSKITYVDILKKFKPEKFNDILESEFIDFISAVTLHSDPYQSIEKSKYLLICTNWDIFKDLNYNQIFELMDQDPMIFDGRSLLKCKQLTEIGFKYEPIYE